ncbi:MAG: flagellar motor switch protein FliG [Miltoncostaeaceae bacterium]
MAPAKQLHGGKKAAILLVSLGSEASAGVFKHLRQEEIDELTVEIASVGHVSPQVKSDVLEEFHETAIANDYMTEGGVDYAREVLEQALGADRANEIMGRLSQSIQVSPFEFLRRTEPSQILNVIANEHPQTIALILAYLPADTAGQVVSALPAETQTEVAMRIALMDRTAPEVIRDIERVLEQRLSSVISQDFTSAGGLQALVELLDGVDRQTEKGILDALEEQNAELAEEVRRMMFLFEDIVNLDDKSVQQVLREVEGKELGVALKGTNDEVQGKIFKNMSQRAAENVKEDLQFMGPVRVKQVEEAQQKIVGVIRRLEEAGQIVVMRGGEDDLVA